MTVLSIKQVATIDPAPTIMVEVSTIHGSFRTAILPDSGADISAAGENILPPLNEYKENLLPSEFRPRVANGQRMCPIGKMCVHFQLAGKEHKEDMYIFPTLDGVIMSWKAAKALHVLTPHYPLPSPSTVLPSSPSIKATTLPHAPLSVDALKREFPTVFDGKIRTMEGEQFHISPSANARPFCVSTPRSVPFAIATS